MSGKPLIGVPPQFNITEQNIFIAPHYMNAVLEGGGLPILIPFVNNKNDITSLVEQFDGFHLQHFQKIPLIFLSTKLKLNRIL